MQVLNEIEIDEIFGGVVEGPNGEGCTDPIRFKFPSTTITAAD